MTPRSARGRRIALALAVLVVPAVLAGCDEIRNNKQNSLEPKGPAATTIDNLFTPVAIVAILVGIFIIVATLYVALKFRRRPGNENPKQVHGNTRLEIGWTIVPALILAIIAVPSVAAIFKLAENPGPKALQVTVVGKQWWWEFHYPDAKVVTADELIIPANRPVYVHLSACSDTIPGCNVIHSFWVPELAGKKDVVPGHDNTMTIEADKPGTFLGQCAEYCGLSHANMRFRVIAKSADDFDTWLQQQQQGPAQPVTTTDADGKQVPANSAADLMINTFGCAGCHTLDDSSKASYGPNLTHLASRTVFASGDYELNRTNLISWLLNAPGMIPMSSQDCRKPPGEGICVGMPSFTENTPKGMKVMTHDEAAEIADFLLGQT
jgi:cytochrome c oxidase subunit 2